MATVYIYRLSKHISGYRAGDKVGGATCFRIKSVALYYKVDVLYINPLFFLNKL